jgi:hypothetical protein
MNVGIIAGQMPYPGGGGGGSAWNPADVSASGGTVFSFTDSDRIATHVSGAATGATVRGVTGHSSGGPWYFEAEFVNAHSTGVGVSIGVADLGATLLDDWVSMVADKIIINNGAALIVSSGLGTFASGTNANTNGNVLGVWFHVGVGFSIDNGATVIPFTFAGNWAPALNLGYDYFGGTSGTGGSIKLLTTAADFIIGLPGGATEWG